MITCRGCGHVYVECETNAKGMNLHTKIGDKNAVIVTPEFYQITDTGKVPKLTCDCNRLDIIFTCDFCARPIVDEPFPLVEDKNGKKLVACERCSLDRPASSTITKAEVSDFKFSAKS